MRTTHHPPNLLQHTTIRERAYTLKRQAPSAPGLPVGFDLSSCPLPIHDLADFRIRRDDAQKLGQAAWRSRERGKGQAEAEGNGAGRVGVDGVYFPLLATVLPKWRAVVHGGAALPLAAGAPPPLVPPMPQQHPQVFKIVFLVSGVGMPRDPSSSATGNSTEGACACACARGPIFWGGLGFIHWSFGCLRGCPPVPPSESPTRD